MVDLGHTRRELLVAGTGAAAMTVAGAAVAGSAVAGGASPAAAFQADRLRRLLIAELLILYCY